MAVEKNPDRVNIGGFIKKIISGFPAVIDDERAIERIIAGVIIYCRARNIDFDFMLDRSAHRAKMLAETIRNIRDHLERRQK